MISYRGAGHHRRSGWVPDVRPRETREWLFLLPLFLLGFVAAITSMVAGGRGLNELSRRGHSGDWPVRTAGGAFNWQARLVLVAVIWSLVSLLDTRSRETELDKLKKQLLQIQNDVNNLKAK